MDSTITHSTMTAYEVADELRVCHRTVLTLIRRGKLRASRAGRSWRITRDALEAYRQSTSNVPAIESPTTNTNHSGVEQPGSSPGS